MIEVSEVIAKVRERLNDNEVGNYEIFDSVLVENINQALLKICLEFKLNKTITRALLTEEERFLTINNLLGIESVKLDKKEIENRNTIEKDNGEIELLILSDKLSVTPFKIGELEVVYFSYNEVNNILESVSMPRVCLEALVYSVLINILEIPTNESNYKEAGFVKLLENKGIGRPSTYASYLPTLLKREYISISQDKKHTITPTHKGKRVIEVFENAYQFIIDLTYTKQMEEVLDEIVENKSSYLDFLQNLATKCPKIEKLERNDDEIKPSSEGQITYIENILRDLQLNLSEEFKNYKEDNRIAKAFLDRYIKEHEFFKKNNKKASSSNNDENRPATPKQISFAEMLAKKHNVKLPKGFKYSMKVCGDFINEYHKK